MNPRDNAPVGNTCPDINVIIEMLTAVADRLDTISGQIEDINIADDLATQSANPRCLYEGRRSPMEELRSANESLRNWGNAECQRANDADEEIKSLHADIRELEAYR